MLYCFCLNFHVSYLFYRRGKLLKRHPAQNSPVCVRRSVCNPLSLYRKIRNFVLLLSFCFFQTLFADDKIPSVSYMDQVVKKKKAVIMQKCSKPKEVKGFMMIELKVWPTGHAIPRLLATDLKQKAFLSCALSILGRVKFKAFSHTVTVSRIYLVFIL